MSKRLFLVAAFLAFSLKLTAFQGFYVGGSTGGSATVGKQTGEVVTSRILGEGGGTEFFFTDLNSDFIDGSWEGNLFAGYGHIWTCALYGGLELFARYAHHDFKIRRETHFAQEGVEDDLTTVRSKFEVGPWHFGIDGRLGYLLRPSLLLYGRLGVEAAPFHIKRRINFSTLGTTPLSLSNSKRRTFAHLRLGIGIEKQFCCNLSFRADYLYTHYGKLTLSQDATNGVLSISDSTKLHLHNHCFLLGLSYLFCDSPYFCVDECCYCREFCGLYLAATVGGSLFEGKLRGDNRSSVTTTGTPGIFSILLPDFVTRTNFTGILYGGVSYQWGYIFSALELFAQYDHPHKRRKDESHVIAPATAVNFDTVFKTRIEIESCQVGIAFRPGLVLNPSTILYGTVGTSAATIKIKTDAAINFSHPGTIAPVSLSLSHKGKNTRATLRLGGGLEYAFRPCWHLRADYVYTDFGSMRVRATETVTTTEAPVTTGTIFANTKVHFKTHAVFLGVSKYF